MLLLYNSVPFEKGFNARLKYRPGVSFVLKFLQDMCFPL